MSRYYEGRDECYDEREDDGDHIDGICADCGKPCTSITIDDGIGSYEYWGAKGTHHDYVEASPCCQAEVVDAEEEEFA